ncbi:ECF transporter S component [Zhihengliuella flava]|uniref:Energy-coupling factor transport system substrate-specific component n=1 Tax=Zhihengliuella flava TaxID=1285193 RepID=A0A931D896_9MICC|nr:ECF transporter S component [Zhihengliuella flava]MBG6084219.1 energy-coupling factor transport system substrate-specific component [Zhihengliuella flava]
MAKTTTWRVADIVIAAVIAVASGVIFWAWNMTYAGLEFLWAAFPPASGLVVGMWLFPGVLGALIIRKPGAALFCEVIAAVISAFLGSQWGVTVLLSGLIQGLGAELVFASFRYRRFGLWVATLAGGAAGLFGTFNDAFIMAWFPEYTLAMKLIYMGCGVVSGLLIAGALSWVLTRAIAKTGALSSLASRKAGSEPVNA